MIIYRSSIIYDLPNDDSMFRCFSIMLCPLFPDLLEPSFCLKPIFLHNSIGKRALLLGMF